MTDRRRGNPPPIIHLFSRAGWNGAVFSDTIKQALEQQVAGQPGAVNSVVRGVTRMISGLTPRERTVCCYLFVGPDGMGKRHLVRSLTRILHGDERRMITADCTPLGGGDPWFAFTSQLAPLFVPPHPGDRRTVLESPPLSIVCVQHLERGPRELSRALAATLESGHVMLPEGRRGVLTNCLVFLTTSLCTREILDEATPIGFTGSQGDDEGDEGENRIYKLCRDQAEEHFGPELVGLLDGLIVFHRLEQDHLAEVLEQRVQRLNQWLAPRGFRCELLPAARSFLLEHGARNVRRGTRDLVRSHRRFVEFPLADLMVSGRIRAGGTVLVDRKGDEEHLHFTVKEGPSPSLDSWPPSIVREIPVEWKKTTTVH